MTATSMTEKQSAALATFIARLIAERGLAHTEEAPGVLTEVQPDGKLFVTVGLPDFPIVSIGKQGGFDMPAIRSYPQVKGETTALDACVNGDKHLARQNAPRATAAAAPAVEQPTVEAGGEPHEGEAPAPAEEPAAPADPNAAEVTVTLE